MHNQIVIPAHEKNTWSMLRSNISTDPNPMHIPPESWKQFVDGIEEKRRRRNPMKFLEPVLKFCEARAHDIDRDSPRRPGYAPQDQLNVQKVYRACCAWKEKGWVNVKKAEVQ